MSSHRFVRGEPGAFVWASSSTRATSGRRVRTASTSSSVRLGAPVLHGAAGDDREAVGLSRGEGPAVRLEEADDDVGAAVLASAALREHGHGLPDAGGGAEVDAQSSAGHGPIVYLSGRRAVVSPPRRRGRG